MTEPENQNQPQQLGSPQGSPQPSMPTEAERAIRSARSLSTVSTIAGPVSFIIGGIALSTVALVCGLVALAKVRRAIDHVDPTQKAYAMALRQTSTIGVAIGAIALIVNIVGVIFMMPVLMEIMQTGDYSAILGDAAIGGASTGTGAWG